MIDVIEDRRRDYSKDLDQEKRSNLGQYFTPKEIALFMSSLFDLSRKKKISLLDPGAGIGSLSAAFLENVTKSDISEVNLQAYEIDDSVITGLFSSLESYKSYCKDSGISLNYKINQEDYIQHSVPSLFQDPIKKFDYIIQNPPYLKISSKSIHRKLLREVGIETVNLYSGFVALSILQLKNNGQMVVIIPRSFCNGPYYKSFRKLILAKTRIAHIHLFKSRNKAFGEDGVLQENVILKLVKGQPQNDVTLSTSNDGSFSDYQERSVSFHEIVKSEDNEKFIHIPFEEGESCLSKSKKVRFSLKDLECQVSTGPVVDFRSKEHLRKMPEDNTAPLIYPAHFNGWTIEHPIENFKKFNAIEINDKTERQLFSKGYYVVIRRFSSKEEKRRIVARVVNPDSLQASQIGFENHLNVIHSEKEGLPKLLAYGLAAYLNSRQVDEYFRIFSGHTQVNATDLRSMIYPSREFLDKVGDWASRQSEFDLSEIDRYIEELL